MERFNPEGSVLLVNALVWTCDERRPTAQAVAVQGDRIVEVGSNEQVRALAGPPSRVIDLQGRLLLPGFNDAHVHFLAGGFSLGVPDLRNATSPKEFAEGLRAYATSLPGETWIQGVDWDHEKWPGTPLPTKDLVDEFTQGHPILVQRFDGHMALANSLALRLAGIDSNTPDPDGGTIVRDAHGQPTGLLKDAAQDLVTKVIPARSRAQKRGDALAATNHAAALGVTSLTDVSADDDLELYLELAAQGLLKTRIYGARAIPHWSKALNSPAPRAIEAPAAMVRSGVIKGFSDGSLGSSTAFFLEGYTDEPGNHGLLFDQMFPEGIMLERVTACDKAGLQVAVHAIGDAANRIVLDIFEKVAAENGPRDRRFRIEHAQHLAASDISRFSKQQVIASMQPYHAADDGCWCDRKLGSERCEEAYAFRSLLDAGATLAFGSDWTVAPLNPLPGIKAAATRETLDGKHPHGWVPQQKISVAEAVEAYTFGSAYAEFAEHHKGTITPGKLADLVALDRNIFSIDPSEIDKARVTLTMVGGQTVFEA